MTSWLLKIFRGIPFSNWVFADLPCMRIIGFCKSWILIRAFFRSETCEWVFLKFFCKNGSYFQETFHEHGATYQMFKSVWRMLKTNIFTHSTEWKAGYKLFKSFRIAVATCASRFASIFRGWKNTRTESCITAARYETTMKKGGFLIMDIRSAVCCIYVYIYINYVVSVKALLAPERTFNW